MYHVAKPTPDQLRWQDMELGVIIHYCMDIYNPDCRHIKNAEVAAVKMQSILTNSLEVIVKRSLSQSQEEPIFFSWFMMRLPYFSFHCQTLSRNFSLPRS